LLEDDGAALWYLWGMKKTARPLWWFIVGLLFLFTGLRDLFLPGFLTISHSTVSATSVAIYLAVGAFFVGSASLAAFRAKKSHAQI
jgi:hypothetical protein